MRGQLPTRFAKSKSHSPGERHTDCHHADGALLDVLFFHGGLGLAHPPLNALCVLLIGTTLSWSLGLGVKSQSERLKRRA
jgi:hypothetical protein